VPVNALTAGLIGLTHGLVHQTYFLIDLASAFPPTLGVTAILAGERCPSRLDHRKAISRKMDSGVS
jgi:hypothetical protein